MVEKCVCKIDQFWSRNIAPTAGGPGDGEHEEDMRSLEGRERADTLASVTHDPLAGVEEGGGSGSDTSQLMAEQDRLAAELEEYHAKWKSCWRARGALLQE